MSKLIKLMIVIATVAGLALAANAGEKSGIQRTNDLEIDVWINKSDGATYYYGEDVAIYFRTSDDCYVVVYDIDPAGNISLLYPSGYDGDCFVRGGEVYRIPDVYDDYRLEVTGPEGKEYIYAIASCNRIDAPDFIRYEYYEYDDWDYYYDDFIHSMRGERAAFVTELNNRIVNGPYVTASAMFYIDDNYRHHRWYRHWTYDPYYIGSIWIGCNFVGAEVWIDGCYYGIAPILVPGIYIGRHWIWIYYHGYPCWQDYVHIRYGQRYYVDAKIKRQYRDFDYGRSNMQNWRFKQKKYRNEPSFLGDAVKYRAKHTRPLDKPPMQVQEKYSKRVSDRQRYTVETGHEKSGLKIKRIDNKFKDRNQQRDVIDNSPNKDKNIRKSLDLDDKDIIIDKKGKKPESKQSVTKKLPEKETSDSKKSKQIKSKPARKSSPAAKDGKSFKSGTKESSRRSRR